MGSLWRSFTEADKKQVTSSEQNVLNGIAYDKASGNFYVTGKRWRTIFVGSFSETSDVARRHRPDFFFAFDFAFFGACFAGVDDARF